MHENWNHGLFHWSIAAGPNCAFCDPTLECFSNTWAFRRHTQEDWHHSGKCCIQTVVCPRLTVTLTSHILAVHGNGQSGVCLHAAGVFEGEGCVYTCACAHTGALASSQSLSLSSFHCLIFNLCSRGYSSAAHLTFRNLQHRFSPKCGKTHFFVFCARPFNLHQMRLVPKCQYSSPKWLTEICTFIIKCDTKLVQALSWMEGLTEMGAVNPFICVRPRKEGRMGLGPQNGTALSPLQTRHHQTCEHELHVLQRTWSAWMPTLPHLQYLQISFETCTDSPKSQRHNSPRNVKSAWTRWGGSIYEINKVCQFSGWGPTPGFCLWLTLGLWGIRSFCACTLVVILLQWESPGAFYLLIQLFGSLLDCRSDAVKPMWLP